MARPTRKSKSGRKTRRVNRNKNRNGPTMRNRNRNNRNGNLKGGFRFF